MPVKSKPPSNVFERKDWILSLAKRTKGVTMADAARRLGISRQAVAQGLVMPSLRVEEYFATLLGYELPELWPDRYLPDGTRIVRTREPDRVAA